MARQVSPGRTVITEKPTAPITSSAGRINLELLFVVDEVLDVSLLNLNFAMFNIAEFVDFN